MEICEVCGVPKTRTMYVCGKKFEMKQFKRKTSPF